MFWDINSWLNIQIGFEKKGVLGRTKSSINIKQNSDQTPKTIKQGSI